MKLRKSYTCPLELVHDIVRGKWKTILIFQMRNEGCSFSALQHSISGISQKVLLEQLGELRQVGLVDKISAPGFPLRVEYFLTERGREMLAAVEIMQKLGAEYIAEKEMAESAQEGESTARLPDAQKSK